MLGTWLIGYPLALTIVALVLYGVSGLLFGDWSVVADVRHYLGPVMTHLLAYSAGLIVGFSRLTRPRGEIGLVEVISGWVGEAFSALFKRQIH